MINRLHVTAVSWSMGSITVLSVCTLPAVLGQLGELVALADPRGARQSHDRGQILQRFGGIGARGQEFDVFGDSVGQVVPFPVSIVRQRKCEVSRMSRSILGLSTGLVMDGATFHGFCRTSAVCSSSSIS